MAIKQDPPDDNSNCLQYSAVTTLWASNLFTCSSTSQQCVADGSHLHARRLQDLNSLMSVMDLISSLQRYCANKFSVYERIMNSHLLPTMLQ